MVDWILIIWGEKNKDRGAASSPFIIGLQFGYKFLLFRKAVYYCALLEFHRLTVNK